MKFWIRSIVLVSLCSGPFGLTGCSSMRVESGHDAAYHFSTVASWDWAPSSGATKTDAAARTSERIRLNGLVREHVVRQLKLRGYERRVTGADLLISWSFGEWQLQRLSHAGRYGAVGLMYPGAHAVAPPKSPDGRALAPSQDPYGTSFERATLEVVAVDSKTQRIVWNASVTDDGDFGYFTSAQRERLGEAVDKVFETFPASQ